MVDDRPEDTGSLPDSSRPKREPPTIDLEATEVSSEPEAPRTRPPRRRRRPWPTSQRRKPPSFGWIPVDSAASHGRSRPGSWRRSPARLAAALVIGVGWMLGWPADQPASERLHRSSMPRSTVSPPVSPIGAEGRQARSADPALPRAPRLWKKPSRRCAPSWRRRGRKARSSRPPSSDVKSAPRGDGTASPDLSGIDATHREDRRPDADAGRRDRAAGQQACRREGRCQTCRRHGAAPPGVGRAARCSGPYRRALSGDARRHQGADAQSGCLEAARSVCGEGRAERQQAEHGTAGAGAETVAGGAQNEATTGTGIVERLQAGAAKLVKIERTDTAGNDRGAVVARITAAALRNDFNEARRELKTLEPDDRAAAQSWLERADARDAALAASRQFATDAMAALAKPAN